MIKATDLCALFLAAYNNGWGYIWGKSGQVWTEALQRRAVNAEAVQYGARWIGHRVADCSGMFVYAFRELGGSIYHGSNTIYNRYCTDKGKIKDGRRADGQEVKPGSAVFLYRNGKRSHIGLYIGNDCVIEARSTPDGVVTSPLEHWDDYGELTGVDYGSGVVPATIRPTLRRNDSGEAVKDCQRLLNVALGGTLAVDGKYGPATMQAVRDFQTTAGLKADGICGPLTWAALDAIDPQDLYTVKITGLTWAKVQSLRVTYPLAEVFKENA